MRAHVCPWWGGYFIDNRLRRWIHNPRRILAPYVQPGMTTLDFGCGMGLFAIAMAELVGDQGRVFAVDLQQRMLDVLARRAQRAGVSQLIRLHYCKPHEIGLHQEIDFALAFYSLHEVPDQRRLLSEIRSLLQPDGSLLVVEPIGHVTAADFDRMLQIAGELSFRVESRPGIRFSRAAILAVVDSRSNG